MSVFDNKLINYGNLAEFHSKIIDDSSVSTLATWSSQLINNELADKQDVLTAGAGIDISNGVISATGGGGSSDAIEDASVLPDAGENKSKLIRLESDNNVYVSELVGISTEEVVAPDAQQIDNAYFEWADITYYKGEVTIQTTSEPLTAYRWTYSEESVGYFMLYPAEEILEHVTDDDEFVCPYGTDIDIYYSNGVYKTDVYTKEQIEVFLTDGDTIPVDDLYIVKQTVTTEVWDWQPLTDNATNDDIDLMFNSESPVIKRVLMKKARLDEDTAEPKYPLSLGEGLVNENNETMEWDGQTYYRWTLYEEDNEGVSSIDYSCMGEQMIYLTTTLNPTLPFDRDSSECAYVITDGEDDYNGGAKVYPKIALIHEDGSITYEE